MAKIPEIVIAAWAKKKGAPVMTTVDKDGMPNTVYTTCVSIYEGEKILVANNFFNKTFANIKDGGKGTFLFLTEDDKAYQIKGTYTHYTEGAMFEDMKKWNPTRLPGVGVAALEVEEIYSGAEKIEF